MSTETTETTQKSVYQLRREAVARAIKAWQDGEESDRPFDDADTLMDQMENERLILLPRSTGHGWWVVEVDGQGAPIAPGSANATGLLGAEEAAEVFLTITAADEYGMKKVTIRPATEWEHKLALQKHLFGGAA